MIFTGVRIESEIESVIDAKLQQGKIHVDYDGRQPSPIKRVRVRVTDSTGAPIANSHGWIVSDGEDPIIFADEHGELLFRSVPLYPGILIAADGYSSKLVQLMPAKDAEVGVNVVLR